MKWPKYVPFFEARHIAIEGKPEGEFCKAPSAWLDDVFAEGGPPCVYARLLKLRRDGEWFFLNMKQNTRNEGRIAARALNELMKSLGYTEPVRGRWTRRG